MTPPTLSRNVATLSSFGSASTGKFVSDCTLQGNTGSWSTIAADEYELDCYTGTLIQRTVDNDGNAVDWSGYSAYRATYNVSDLIAVTSTTYTNESTTFAENDTGFSPVGTEGQLNLAISKNLHTNFGWVESGAMIGGAIITTDHASFFQEFGFDELSLDVTSGTMDITRQASSYVFINSSTGNFTVRGIETPARGGTLCILDNTTSNNMTIQNNGSPAAGYSKIITGTANESTTGKGTAVLIYNSANAEWHLLSIRG